MPCDVISRPGALIIDGGHLHKALEAAGMQGDHTYLQPLVLALQQVYGLTAFVRREWHQGTESGKPSGVHLQIEQGPPGFDLRIRGCKYQRGAFEEQTNDGRWRRCARQGLRMRVEKGVDVAIALAMAIPPKAEKDGGERYGTVVVVTGDGDLEPAFRAARASGLRIHVCSARGALSDDLRPFLHHRPSSEDLPLHHRPANEDLPLPSSTPPDEDLPASCSSSPASSPPLFLDDLLLLVRGRPPKCQFSLQCMDMPSEQHRRRFIHPCPLGPSCPLTAATVHNGHLTGHTATDENGGNAELPPPSVSQTSLPAEYDPALRAHLLSYLHRCPHQHPPTGGTATARANAGASLSSLSTPDPVHTDPPLSPAPPLCCTNLDPLHLLLFDHPCTGTPTPSPPQAPTAAGSLLPSSSSSSSPFPSSSSFSSPAQQRGKPPPCPLGSKCKDFAAHHARARRRSRSPAFIGAENTGPTAEHMAAFSHPCPWGSKCRTLHDPVWNWEHVLGHSHGEEGQETAAKKGRVKNGDKNRRGSRGKGNVDALDGDSGLARLMTSEAESSAHAPAPALSSSAERGGVVADVNVNLGHGIGQQARDDRDRMDDDNRVPGEIKAVRLGGGRGKTKNRDRKGRGSGGPSLLQSFFGSARRVAPEPDPSD